MTAVADHSPAARDLRTGSENGAPPTQRRSTVRGSALLAAGVLIGVELVWGWDWLATAATAMLSADLLWILVAVSSSIASMVCFGALRRDTARAARVEVPLGEAVSMSYAAGALHTTLPGGAVFSTAYAFRELRRWGASATTATWCLAITGVLSAATLAMVGLGSIVVGGGLATSASGMVIEIAAMAALLGLILTITRRPLLLLPAAHWGLRAINRIRRQPAGTGGRQLTSMVTDLACIRPTAGQWASATGLSLTNWLFDAGCLWACCSAVGVQVSLPIVLLAYTAGMAAVSLSPLPAGVGVAEGALAIGLTAAGATAPAALAAVLIYRLITIGGVVVIGWLVLAARRNAGPGSVR